MRLQSKIDIVGAAAFATYLGHALLSWGLAAGRGIDPNAIGDRREYFRNLSESLWWAPDGLRGLVANGGPFQDWHLLAAGYALPLLLQTLAFAAALWFVYRASESVLAEEQTAARLHHWAIAFAVASVIAFDVMTPDIWLAVPWGRTILQGHDPYQTTFTLELVAGTPGLRPIQMTYGPLWAAVSALDALIAIYSPLLACLATKILLLGAWLACLALVARLAQALSVKRQAAAMAIMGWLPIGVHNIVAEGHNDAVMVMFLLLWLVNLQSTSWKGPVFFVASVLTKLVVIPAAIVDAVYHLRARTMTLRGYAMRAVPAVVIAVPAAAFLLSDHRLDAARDMRYWRFLHPTDLLLSLESYLGLTIPFKLGLIQLVAAVVILRALAGLWQKPAPETAWMAVFAILSGVMFSALGHVWPWFYVWLLPFAALMPASLLTSFVLSAAIVAQFSTLRLLLGDGNYFADSFAVYGTGLAVVTVRACMMWRGREGQSKEADSLRSLARRALQGVRATGARVARLTSSL